MKWEIRYKFFDISVWLKGLPSSFNVVLAVDCNSVTMIFNKVSKLSPPNKIKKKKKIFEHTKKKKMLVKL